MSQLKNLVVIGKCDDINDKMKKAAEEVGIRLISFEKLVTEGK